MTLSIQLHWRKVLEVET